MANYIGQDSADKSMDDILSLEGRQAAEGSNAPSRADEAEASRLRNLLRPIEGKIKQAAAAAEIADMK